MTFASLIGSKYKFVALVSLLIFAGFTATSLTSYFVAHNSIAKQITESALPLTSDNIYSEIQRDLMQPIFISSLMAQDTFLREWVISGEMETDKITRYLAGIQEQYQTVTAFFVSNESANYYHSSGRLKAINSDDKQDAWYFRVAQMPSEYEINLDYDTAKPDRLVVFINYKVFDFDENFIGATGVGLALTKVKALIESYQNRFQRKVYFIDRAGKVTLRGEAYQDSTRLFTTPEYQALLSSDSITEQAAFSYSDDGNHVHVNARYIPEFDWYVVIEQQDNQLTSSLFTSLIFNLAVSLIITLVVLVVSYFLITTFQTKLEYMATVDKLSGAYNRHGSDILFKQCINFAKRKSTPLSAILLDIDYFKKINDKHGHLVGDKAIKQVADVVKSQLRNSDALCRWGGEEFLIILPECDLDSARQLAEKIRTELTKTAFLKDDFLSASFGVGSHIDGETEADWVNRLDLALYQAKHNGRNRVELANS